MHVLDASSIVHAWDNYRIDKFPRLWDWLELQAVIGVLVIPAVAHTEVGYVSLDCQAWLDDVPVEKIEMSPHMLARALSYKQQLGVVGDSYHPKGVDENDLFIIACAHELGACLISNEAIQAALPINPAQYKIPAVCGQMAACNCIDFLTYINQTPDTF